MSNKINYVVVGCLLAVSAYLYVNSHADVQTKQSEAEKMLVSQEKHGRTHTLKSARKQRIKQSVENAMDKHGYVKPSKNNKDVDRQIDGIPEDLPKSDIPLANKIRAAMDADDAMNLINIASSAFNSTNAELRLFAVESLVGVSSAALPEIATMLIDPDEDVAEAAKHLWEQGLTELDDPALKFSISIATIQTLNDDAMVDYTTGLATAAAYEFTAEAEDELAATVEVVQVLADIITGESNFFAEKYAREIYESVTSEAWTNIDDAEAYLQQLKIDLNDE